MRPPRVEYLAAAFEGLKDLEWANMLTSLENKAAQYVREAADLRQLTISNATR